MTPAEVAMFLAKVSSIDNRRVTTQTADAWSEVLDSRVTLNDAWEAARDHFATKAGEYLMPGHINDRAKVMRKARLDAMRIPDPPESIDPDDVPKGLAWTRAYRSAIAHGHDEQRADEIACVTVGVRRPPLVEGVRPVAQLVQQTERAIKRPPARAQMAHGREA